LTVQRRMKITILINKPLLRYYCIFCEFTTFVSHMTRDQERCVGSFWMPSCNWMTSNYLFISFGALKALK
jgi:hypothetical protein